MENTYNVLLVNHTSDMQNPHEVSMNQLVDEQTINTVTNLVASADELLPGQRIKTLGYRSVADGGGASYLIERTKYDWSIILYENDTDGNPINYILNANGLPVKADNTQVIDPNNSLYANIQEFNEVNYRQFGGYLNGVDSDLSALLLAHSFCNANKVLLRNKSGTIYKTGDMNTSIIVKYDVDLRGSTLLINENCLTQYRDYNTLVYDYNLWTSYIYDIQNDSLRFRYNRFHKADIKKDTCHFTEMPSVPNGSVYLSDNVVLSFRDATPWALRDSGSTLYNWHRSELMVHNSAGVFDGLLTYGFDDEESVIGWRYDNYTPENPTGDLVISNEGEALLTHYNSRHLTFRGCEVKVEGGFPRVYFNIITCRRHNTTISDFTIKVSKASLLQDEGLTVENSSYRNSVINVKDCYNVTVKNINGMNFAGNYTEYRGSGYAIRFMNTYKTVIDNCNIMGFWGATGMANVKDVIVQNSKLNRVDIHDYFYNLTVRDSVIYDNGVVIGGGRGVCLISGCKFIYPTYPDYGDHTLLNLGTSYGTMFEGLVKIENCEIIKNGQNNTLICSNFKPVCTCRAGQRFPNIIARDITIREATDTSATFTLYDLSGSIGDRDYLVGMADFVIIDNIKYFLPDGTLSQIGLVNDTTTGTIYDTTKQTDVQITNVDLRSTDGGIVLGSITL